MFRIEIAANADILGKNDSINYVHGHPVRISLMIYNQGPVRV